MDDIHKNMMHFNRVILELFVRLYDSFPHPLHINSQIATDIGLRTVFDDRPDMETSHAGIMPDDVMEWLKEEGFIRYEPDPNYRPGTFSKVRLTLRGLTILGYIPVSLQQTDANEPLIKKARKAMTPNGEKESIDQVVGEIFKMALAQWQI
jgi:hypothetical protein